MAKEFLRRTPTSTGNRKVWTWSGWVKLSDFGVENILFGAYLGGSNRYVILNNTAGDKFQFFGGDYNIVDSSTTYNTWNLSTNSFRDCGSWMHVMAVYNTTESSAEERFKMYVNGKRLSLAEFSSGNATPAINSSTYINALNAHFIGAWGPQADTANQSYEGEMFDVFLVDGQALTPDVFGFYKDGDGYQSSGTTQATDFRPGQWSPRLPKSIKYTINRSGGFGVNGFYLPMNDSSNPGADFHCAPNSIIKLKGEDLPQPQNGAPITSDAYVSELRTDPYAANLVLAVPGASTATGANLVTNGTFDTNTTGWTSQDATLSVDSGRIKVLTTNTNFGSALQTVTGLTVGQRYTFQVDMFYGNASMVTAISGATPSINSGWQGADYVWRASFTASTTSLVIDFQMASINAVYGFWDNVVLKQEDAPRDYSADIKGSGTNKTLTPVGDAGVGYELGNYYGSAMTFDGSGDYFTVPNTSDLRMGSDDFTIEAWVNKNDTISGNIFGLFENGNNRRSYLLYSDGSGDLSAIVSTDGTSATNTQLGTSAATNLGTNQWHHCALEREGSYLRLYLNGVVAGIATNLSGSLYENTTDTPAIGAWFNSGVVTGDMNGYVQDLRVYKGVAKYKGGFDVPKPYTPVGIESWRTTDDTCKNNFATLNAVDNDGGVLSNGNLTQNDAGSDGWNNSRATIGASSGKWYWEMRVDVISQVMCASVAGPSGNDATNGARLGYLPGQADDAGVTYYDDGKLYHADSQPNGQVGWGAAYGATDVIGIALDMNDSGGKVWFSKNGSWQGSGNPSTGANAARNDLKTYSDTYFPISGTYFATEAQTFNFGQNPSFSGQTTAGTFTDDSGKGLFKYAPPTGFLALCEDNLPAPAIADPGKHFKSVLYTGSGVAGHPVTGVGFKPDFVWLKGREGSSLNHILNDVIRGPVRTLFTNNALQQYTDRGVSSFDEDGFTLSVAGGDENATNVPYVAWCWKAGGPAVSNTEGNITTQVSANPTAGFSIVKSNGPGTSGHGLNSTPKFIIQKSTTAGNWNVAHHDLYGPTDTGKLLLNSTGPVVASGTTYMHNATATTFDPLFSAEQIAYVWAEVEGFSKFGSYVGNGSTDGPFVYCGFKPAWVLVKNIDTAGSHWVLWDSSRTPYNEMQNALRPNSIDPETSGFQFDFLSNGFKVRDGELSVSESGDTIIFAAFAESPFQTANAK